MSFRTVEMLPERCVDCGGAKAIRIDADLEEPCDCSMPPERRRVLDDEPCKFLQRQAD